MVKIDEAYKTLHLFILLTFIPKLKFGNKNYRLPRLKYKRKIIAGPERSTNASDVNCAITFQLIIFINLKFLF